MSVPLEDIRRAAVINTLRSCQLFSGLPVADLEKVAAVAMPKSLDKGDYLFREGDPSAGFFVVQSGAVNVHRVSAVGRAQVIHVFRAGDSFAEATLAAPNGCHADAQAVEPTHVLLIQKDGILNLLKRQPELALRMLGAMSNHLRVLVGQLEDFTLKDVESRLAHWLIKRCPHPGGDEPVQIVLTATKGTLAAELGTISETLSRLFAKFKKMKLVTVNGRTITVLSPAGLRRLLEKNLGDEV
ncbi:MAG TPA: Crp/Fnr family transcriptional regulator [Verrucomicrobiae bacterium]